MGFACIVLKGISPVAAVAWKLAKLANSLKNSHGPVVRLTNVAAFALDILKPDLSIVTAVVSGVIEKALAQSWAKSTDKYLGIISPDHEITLEQANTAFEVTRHNHAPKELLAKAGFLYLALILGKLQADDVELETRYCADGGSGRFDHTAALCDFYGTSAALRLARALKEYDHRTLTPAVRADILMPVAEEAWSEVQGKVREDVIDLLLL